MEHEAIKAVLLDLDGTVYRGSRAVPGAIDFLDFLTNKQIPYLFVTNRTNRTPVEIAAQLNEFGIPCTGDQILTSAQATAEYLQPGSVYCIGEAGLLNPLQEAGFIFTDTNPDYVIVGFDRGINYEKLENACIFIQNGAEFVGTNPDVAVNMDRGVCPGNGAILAAIIAVTGIEPLVIGKPEAKMIHLALDKLGIRGQNAIMVGDYIETDVIASHNANIRSVLITTGLSQREDLASAKFQPTWVVDSYRELEDLILSKG